VIERVIFGCKWGANCTQIAPNFADLLASNHPVSHLECMAWTTGLEPATSAVTVEARMVTVIVPYRARDLCPVDLCPAVENRVAQIPARVEEMSALRFYIRTAPQTLTEYQSV